MEKFEYAELEQKLHYGNWYFFLDGKRLGEQYVYASLVDVLNLIGQEGWQLVSTIDSENFIVMRKTKA